MPNPISTIENGNQRRPGFLLEPLGWVQDRLGNAIATAPHLPDTLLPIRIGAFRRLDGVAEIRALAKTWRNCLAEYLFNINDGTAALYLSEDWEAVCFVCRYGRLGWFLLQTKGPRNVGIEPQKLVHIHTAFADVGILQSSMIEAIKRVLMTHEWSRRRQARDDDEIFDDIAAY